jgi:hypothetical protein
MMRGCIILENIYVYIYSNVVYIYIYTFLLGLLIGTKLLPNINLN